MTPEDVIREVQEHASEYLEMAKNPDELMTGILANKIVQLNSYIQYLERRLKHDSSAKTRVN